MILFFGNEWAILPSGMRIPQVSVPVGDLRGYIEDANQASGGALP